MDKYTMRYNRQDLDWTADRERILIDEKLNTDSLGWRNGDLFKYVNQGGKQMLVKVENSTSLKGKENGRSS